MWYFLYLHACYRQVAGVTFDSFEISHAGLGVWDTTTDEKFSIEFLCDSYVGSLFPILHPETSSIEWNNSASIVVTTPTKFDDWIESSLVSTTRGAAYNNLIQYIQDNTNTFRTYQPVSVILTNASALVNVSTVAQIESPSEIGAVVLHDLHYPYKTCHDYPP